MDFITVMEWIGTVAFAVSGAAAAIEKDLDYYGICFLSIITAIGGGIIRDVLVGQILPASLADPAYAAVSLAVGILCILFYRKLDRISHLVSVADAFGLAAFTAIGCRVAVESGYDAVYVILALSVLTGTFGGVLRDVFYSGDPPLLPAGNLRGGLYRRRAGFLCRASAAEHRAVGVYLLWRNAGDPARRHI